jgi:hypothetical protein
MAAHLARERRACAPRACSGLTWIAGRRPTSSKEYVMERKELAFFIAMGGLVLVAIVAVVSRFV